MEYSVHAICAAASNRLGVRIDRNGFVQVRENRIRFHSHRQFWNIRSEFDTANSGEDHNFRIASRFQ